MDHVAPGEVIHRRLLATNTSRKRLHLELYPTAAVIRSGTFLSGQGRSGNDLTSWITFDRTSLDLPAGRERPVAATIRIPATAPSGERYAALLAETASPAGQGGIREINRVGVRVYLDVGPGGEPRSDFRVDALVPGRTDGGLPRITTRVHNTGRRALDISGSLTLTEKGGPFTAGPFLTRGVRTLAPGGSATVTVFLDRRVSRGPWIARLTLRSGALDRAASATVTFPADTRASTPSSRGTGHRTQFLTAAAALLTAALTGLYLYMRRTRRAKRTTAAT